ncbi:MAG: ATP-binding cassette domain-containing protein, partial [Nitrospirae bacterium]|nr:ATP-binding cassette domain-containing protein [Nitrospirota bacterium]
MIEIIDLYKSFGQKYVLRGVNLKVQQGESMVVIGGSGSGKSVLMKHIIGLVKPDKGNVMVAGRDISRIDEKGLYETRRKFGMLFQGAALFDSMKVWENVSFVLMREKGMSREDARQTAIQ